MYLQFTMELFKRMQYCEKCCKEAIKQHKVCTIVVLVSEIFSVDPLQHDTVLVMMV